MNIFKKAIKMNKEESTVLSKEIRHVLVTDKESKESIKSLEKDIQDIKENVNSTADRVALAMSNDQYIKEKIERSLVNNFTFRRRIAEEILIRLLEEDTERV